MIETARKRLIEAALEEDLAGIGDLTAMYFVPADSQSCARMVSREPCALAGIELAAEVFQQMDDSLEVEVLLASGSKIGPGEVNKAPILEVRGQTRSILTAERTALNFAQRLAGVATLTAQFVDAVEGTKAVILDTRKTTPGWRLLEKEAVLMGGGQNHRMGLYDRVMVKDNHLISEDRLTALQDAIDCLRQDHPSVEVELEADTLEQVQSFLTLNGVHYILLDNMAHHDMQTAVELVKDTNIALEASGGITLETVRAAAETGVDYISVGALTHSSRSIDLSLESQRL